MTTHRPIRNRPSRGTSQQKSEGPLSLSKLPPECRVCVEAPDALPGTAISEAPTTATTNARPRILIIVPPARTDDTQGSLLSARLNTNTYSIVERFGADHLGKHGICACLIDLAAGGTYAYAGALRTTK